MKAALKISLVIAFIFSGYITNAQLNRQWLNEYSMPDSAYMNVIGLYDADNGNVIKASLLTKFSPPNNYNKLLLQKISPTGNIIWDELYEHPVYDQFHLYGGGIDGEGNTYFSGQVVVNQSTSNWFVISFDASGQERWQKNTVDNIFTSGGSQRCVIDADGNAYASGSVNGNGISFGVIVKYNSAGAEQWVKYDSLNYSFGADMVVAQNGDIITSDGQYEIMRLAPNGNVLWTTPDTAEWIYVTPSITEAADGSIYAISFLGYNYSLKKLDANGNFQWNYQQFSEYLAFGDNSVKVRTDAQSNVYVIGVNSTDPEEYQTAVFKFNPNGTEIWRQVFWDNIYDVHDIWILPTGNPVVASTQWTGGPYFSAVILLNGGNGEIVDVDSLDVAGGQEILLYNSAGLYMAATGNYATAIVKYSATVSIDESEGNIYNIQIYPNPFSEFISIKADAEINKYELRDITGKLIKMGNLNGNATVSLQDLSAGTYLITFTGNSGEKFSRKIIKS